MVSLIDTDVMIDLSRGNVDAANYLDSLSDPAISIVTAQELTVPIVQAAKHLAIVWRRVVTRLDE